MDDLVTWLRAQLDEDENLARESFGDHNWDRARALVDVEAKRRILDAHRAVPMVDGAEGIACATCGPFSEQPGPHWSHPGEDWTPCKTVKLLALPYAGESGYREEWRP